MKKKLLGIKLRSVFTALMCLLVAFIFWLYINFDSSAAFSFVGGLLH